MVVGITLAEFIGHTADMLNTKYDVLSEAYKAAMDRLTKYYLGLRACGYTDATVIQLSKKECLEYLTFINPKRFKEPVCLGTNDKPGDWGPDVFLWDWFDYLDSLDADQMELGSTGSYEN